MPAEPGATAPRIAAVGAPHASPASPAASAVPARAGAGVALIMLAAALFAAMDTSVKLVGQWLPVLLVLWARYACQALAMAAWLARRPGAGFRVAHPRFQLVRGLLLLGTSAASYLGVQVMPVAEFTAIAMLTPVVVTLLAAWLLHERVSALRWTLVAGGFASALAVIRPGSGLIGWAALLPLAGTLCYAGFQVLTGKLAALEHPLTTHFWTGAVGAAALTPLLLAGGGGIATALGAAPPLAIGLLLLIGALGTVGHLLLLLAFGRAPTATLMPFLYVQILVAAGLGWLAFGHVPDAWAWAGMAGVALCGGASAWLNVRDGARRPVSALETDTVVD